MAAGFVGGLLGPSRPVNASPPEVIRASAYEIVSSDGVPLARWSANGTKEVHLTFLRSKDQVSLDLGVGPDGRPYLSMLGADGKNRVGLRLDHYDKPFLSLSDERSEGRIHIGFMAPDTIPYGDWDRWVIGIRAPGVQTPTAALTVVRQADGRFESSAKVKDE